MNKDEKTVVLYPNGSAYDILQFDMDRQEIIGQVIAQCIYLKKSYFRIIGLLDRGKGKQKPIKCLIHFNGVDKIKANGDSRFQMKLIKRLSPQEMLSIVHDNNPAPTAASNLSGNAGFVETQVPYDQVGTSGNLPPLLPNNGSPKQNGPMSLNNAIPQQNAAFQQQQSLQLHPQPTRATQQQISQYSHTQNTYSEQRVPSGPGRNYSQYQQTIHNNQQPSYPVQSYPQRQNTPYAQTGFLPQDNIQANGVQSPAEPKRKKRIGKKIFKGIGAAIDIVGDLGVVPGLGIASKVVKRISNK